MTSVSKSTRVIGVLAAYAIAALVYAWSMQRAPLMYLDVVIQSGEDSAAQAYVAGRGEGFSEQRAPRYSYRAGETRLLLPIMTPTVERLRLDPTETDGPVSITRLRLLDRRGVILDAIDFSRVHAGNEIARLDVQGGALRVIPVTGSRDANLSIDLPQPVTPESSTTIPALALLALLSLPLVWRLTTHVIADTRPLAGMQLAFVFGLVICAAVTMMTSRSVNPDEAMHVGAARYYFDHWLPPAVGDEHVAHDPDAYGVWGLSYLDEWDVGYFLAAKFAVALAPIVADETVRLRLFNVLLLAVLSATALRRRWAAPLIPLLLLSPQVWYVFGYFNADAIALATSALAVFCLDGAASVLLSPDVPALRSREFWSRHGRIFFGAAVLLALVIVSKRNFWTTLPFIGLVMLIRMGLASGWTVALVTAALISLSTAGLEVQYSFAQTHVAILHGVGFAATAAALVTVAWRLRARWNDNVSRQILLRLGALALVATFFAIPRIAWDVAVNGGPSQKFAAVVRTENQFAIPSLKPDVIRAGGGYPNNQLLDRGVPLHALLGHEWQWPALSLRSTFGVYGYMEYVTAPWIELVLILSALITSVLAFGLSFKNRGALETFAIACVIVTVAANSLLFSWIAGFQPQGRYLFPLLPFVLYPLSLASGTSRAVLDRLLVVSVIAGAFSFLGYGLVRLV